MRFSLCNVCQNAIYLLVSLYRGCPRYKDVDGGCGFFVWMDSGLSVDHLNSSMVEQHIDEKKYFSFYEMFLIVQKEQYITN